MTIRLLQHNSPDYTQMLALRVEVLLNPIGIPPTYIKTDAENTDFLIGAYEGKIMIGCCVLTPKVPGVLQLRQMAVHPLAQGTGVGAAIVTFAEETAREHRYTKIKLHARSVVAPFYAKSGYKIDGDEFEEVGIAHVVMTKDL